MEKLIHEASHFENMKDENGKVYNVVMFTTEKETYNTLPVPSGNPDLAYEVAQKEGVVIESVSFLKEDNEPWHILTHVENDQTIVYGVPHAFVEEQGKMLNVHPYEFKKLVKQDEKVASTLYEAAKQNEVIYGEYTISHTA